MRFTCAAWCYTLGCSFFHRSSQATSLLARVCHLCWTRGPVCTFFCLSGCGELCCKMEDHRCEDDAAHSCLCLGLGQTIGCVLLQVSPCVSTLGDPFGISIYSRSVLYTVYESGARRSTGGRIKNYSRAAVLQYRSSHRRSHLQHDSKQRHWALRTRVARARNLAPRRNQSQRDEARNEGPLVH